MGKQIAFIIVLAVTLGVFTFTALRIYSFFKQTKPFPIKDFGKRFWLMMKVAIAQTKIFRLPVVGFLHAMVFWGFILICIGSVEMVFDGVLSTEKLFAFLGPVYDAIIGLGDFFAWFIAFAILVFLFRRIFMTVKRFYGIEMKPISKIDANIALTIILLLMVSLIGMNTFYLALFPEDYEGWYPVSQYLVSSFSGLETHSLHFWYELNWWVHIVLVFIFANILPYSKHFHVFMSVPNVFFSRLEPLGYLPNMPNITEEVKLMLDPEAAFAKPAETDEEPERFGVLDAEDVTWKNYMDSLACTECGRCTSVCPANITGKKLSPRKIMIDLRARMKEKGPGLVKEGKTYSDNKSLIRDYISEEELWACTTCNACAMECPININHPTLIVDMRRYLVMEESAAPAMLNTMFSNIENNGAPWQYSAEDRMLWAEDLYIGEK
ncbi:MAG: (Fe-S)-binding protein [Bacteroidales bacterium]|nr:(Fe-S)-binding protein [Bacteroidales bacterium]MCF8454512.1 (Fe-S)-binding protein [Bacteroidales bacterium]